VENEPVRGLQITTGEFGRLSGLSSKALRLYDMSGLLSPASVDPFTGYRRYAPEQLERARRIGMLRQVDMPLAVIADVLAGSDADALARLNRWWAGQEATMRSRKGSVDFLRTELTRAGDPGTNYPVEIASVGATKLATISQVVDQSNLVSSCCDAEDRIRRYLLAAGAVPSTEHYVIFYGVVSPENEATVEVCVPFGGTVDPDGEIVIRGEPAHTYARCTVTRGECFYPQIMLAYVAVNAYLDDRRLTPTGPPREMYFVGWDEITDDDPFVHIALPVDTVTPLGPASS
jgi:DNA-binding transcriptional MerR regulator